MKRLLLALAAVLVLSRRAGAATSLHLDDDLNPYTYFSSFTAVTSKTLDPMGFGSVGFSSITANAFGYSYSVYGNGGSADWTVTVTTRTASTAKSSRAFTNASPWAWQQNAASLSTSTVIEIPQGLLYNDTFDAFGENPVFTFTNLSASATYYLWVKLGLEKRQ